MTRSVTGQVPEGDLVEVLHLLGQCRDGLCLALKNVHHRLEIGSQVAEVVGVLRARPDRGRIGSVIFGFGSSTGLRAICGFAVGRPGGLGLGGCLLRLNLTSIEEALSVRGSTNLGPACQTASQPENFPNRRGRIRDTSMQPRRRSWGDRNQARAAARIRGTSP